MTWEDTVVKKEITYPLIRAGDELLNIEGVGARTSHSPSDQGKWFGQSEVVVRRKSGHIPPIQRRSNEVSRSKQWSKLKQQSLTSY